MNALGNTSTRLLVQDPSQVAEARRAIAALAQEVGFDETDSGRASLVASEMATNLVKHARGGSIIVQPLFDGMDLLAVDQGPGMGDPNECLRDGYSTAGSSGTGLGAIRRLSDAFDLFSRVGSGTVVLGRLRNRRRPAAASRFLVGAVSLPIDGETLCGDGWTCRISGECLRVALFDGIGHGSEANDAADAALAFITAERQEQPAALLQRIHLGIRHTRGAAGSIYDLYAVGGILRYAGVGNITATIIGEANVARGRQLMSHNGTLGHLATRFQEFTQPWTRGDLLILSSDGLTNRWDLSRYPGLGSRDPAVVAAVLWRDFSRGRDDVTVVVIRES